MPRWLDGVTLGKAAGVGMGVGVVLGGLIAYAGRTPPLPERPVASMTTVGSIPTGAVLSVSDQGSVTVPSDASLRFATDPYPPSTLFFGWGSSREQLIAQFPAVCWQSHCRPMGAVLDFLDSGDGQ